MVEEVSLQDIDILAAIGDSYTAGFAANSPGLLHYFTEYRGTSFVTGERVRHIKSRSQSGTSLLSYIV